MARARLVSLLGLLAGAACGGGHSGADADASVGDASDAPDVPCPSMLPADRSGCPVGGQGCWFDEAGAYETLEAGSSAEHSTRCDCVGPEMQWVCCDLSYPCPNIPETSDGGRASPAFVTAAVMKLAGGLCCSVNTIGPGVLTSGCGYYPCDPAIGEPQVTCASNDHHWRFSYAMCAPWMENPWGDASADAGADGPDDATMFDAGTPDASADSPDGGG